METKKIVVEVESNLGSLKSQLREAQAEVSAMSEKFGATSKEAINAAKAAARLKDTIGDAKQLTDAFNPDAKFKALTASMSGALNGFQAVQGAMGLFGTESEDVEKMLLKVQSAMALAQGVDGLLEAKDAFKTFGASIVSGFQSISSGAKTAFAGVKGAIAATGIGLIVVGLGLVVANFDKIKEAAGKFAKVSKEMIGDFSDKYPKTFKAIKTYIEYAFLPITLAIAGVKKLNDVLTGTTAATRAVAAEQARVQAARMKQIDEEKKAQADVVKGLDRKIALLESEGKSTIALRKEKQKLQLQEAEMNLQALQFVAQAMSGSDVMKGLYAELINNAKDTVNKLKIEGNNITTDAKAENQKRLDDAKAKADALKTVKDNNWSEDQKRREELLAEELFYQSESDKGFEKEKERIEKEKQDAIDLEFTKRNQIALTAKLEADKRLLDEAADKTELERKKANILLGVQMGINALSAIGDIAEVFAGDDKKRQKNAFNIKKAANIAQATMDTFKGAQSAFADTPGGPVIKGIAAGIAGAVGFANVAKIAKTKFDDGGSGGGGGGGGNNSSSLSALVPTAPTPANFNLVGNSNTNQLLQGLQNQPIQAYVVGGDVTSQQSLDRNKITTASI